MKDLNGNNVKRDPENLPIHIGKKYFYQFCSDRREYFVLYTDWIAKLQRFHRPVNKWIKKKLPSTEEMDICTLCFDTRDLVTKLRWFNWSADDLYSIRRMWIKRFAIDQFPPWLYKMPNLERLDIWGEYEKESYVELVANQFLKISPLHIPVELAQAPCLQHLNIYHTDQYAFTIDPGFSAQNHITNLIIDIDGLQSPLSDLSRFPVLEDLEICSSHPLTSYQFLTFLPKIKSLTLHTEMDHLPEEIRSLHSLETLDLSENYLKDIPPWINTLHRLRTLIIDCPPYQDTSENKTNFFYKDMEPMTEFPSTLRICPSLIYCTLGIPARSLFNLPPTAQYWAAVSGAYGFQDNFTPFDLPVIVVETVHREFAPSFQFHNDPREIGYSDQTLRQYIAEFTLEYGSRHIDIYIIRGYPKSCILCGCSLEDKLCPFCRTELILHEGSINRALYCERCNVEVTTGICPRCGVDNRLGPENHPDLVAFLATFYADSYETLFQQVKNGEKLTSLELERFIHETTYQYYQLLSNTAHSPLDSTIIDALTTKFSIEINSKTKTRILL